MPEYAVLAKKKVANISFKFKICFAHTFKWNSDIIRMKKNVSMDHICKLPVRS